MSKKNQKVALLIVLALVAAHFYMNSRAAS
jgi:hypothetical protein